MPKHDISHPAAPSGQGFASPLLAAQVSDRSVQPLTPWFPGDVKPARPGVYERDWDRAGNWFALWTGKEWRTNAPTASDAARRKAGTNFPRLLWRGLANDPALNGSPAPTGRGQMTKEMP